MTTVTPYTLVIIVHVASAALLIGGGTTGSLLRAMVRRARTGQELGMWLEFGRKASQFNPIIALVLLGTGIYMGSTGWWSDPWFAFAAVLWLVDALLAIKGIKNSAAALGAALGRARGQLTPEVIELRESQTWDICMAALRANNVTMLFVMFQKPGLIEALGVFALSQAVSLGAYAIGRSRQAAERHDVVAATAPAAHA